MHDLASAIKPCHHAIALHGWRDSHHFRCFLNACRQHQSGHGVVNGRQNSCVCMVFVLMDVPHRAQWGEYDAIPWVAGINNANHTVILVGVVAQVVYHAVASMKNITNR